MTTSVSTSRWPRGANDAAAEADAGAAFAPPDRLVAAVPLGEQVLVEAGYRVFVRRTDASVERGAEDEVAVATERLDKVGVEEVDGGLALGVRGIAEGRDQVRPVGRVHHPHQVTRVHREVGVVELAELEELVPVGDQLVRVARPAGQLGLAAPERGQQRDVVDAWRELRSVRVDPELAFCRMRHG